MDIKLVSQTDIPFGFIRNVNIIPNVIQWRERIFIFWYHLDCNTQVFREGIQHNYTDKELELFK